ncbi:MAG: TetR/AcrR family transcriptional regulator [Oscillospiraceae bacterium]
MGKLDIKKKEKQDALLASAYDLFTRNGFSKTSISDISSEAGVAKGTFYLYFKDKYDIRNKLVCHKSSKIFLEAAKELEKHKDTVNFEDKILFLVDYIVNYLNNDKYILTFISKNLSWGIFKTALTDPLTSDDLNFRDVYQQLIESSGYKFKDPEIMLFLIVELVNSTCYSVILNEEPVGLEEYKPYLIEAVRSIIEINKIKD